MRFAGITKVYIVFGEGKWDIQNYFGNGLMVDMNLAYLTYLDAHKKTAIVTAELSIGEVIQAGIEAGLHIQAMPSSENSYLDVGTPEDLVPAVQRYAFC